jgi:hypothetical protein
MLIFKNTENVIPESAESKLKVLIYKIIYGTAPFLSGPLPPGQCLWPIQGN